MEYLLFIIYLVVAVWWFPRISFVKLSSLNPMHLRILLGFKILFGLICAFYFENFSTNFDYITYNYEGRLQYELLLAHPFTFFTDFSRDWQAYGPGGVFATQQSFWGYLRFNLLYKFVAVLNLLTQGNFYLNSALFSSLVFFAHIAFYRIYNDLYPRFQLISLALAFFLPSLLLYTSCIHKDGLVYMGLALACFLFYRWLTTPHTMRVIHLVVFVSAFLTIFLFRNYVLVALLPAMVLASGWKYTRGNKPVVIGVGYLLLFTIFFLSVYTPVNLPAAVIQRKADFEALGQANTNIPMNELLPNLQSFLVNLPQALNHVLLRPYPWEFPQFSVMFTALELLFYQLLFLLWLFYRRRPLPSMEPFTVFGLAFFFHMVLIIGYTIPNVGAIVRYRSIFWIFLLGPLLGNLDWQKLNSLFKKRRWNSTIPKR